MGRLQRSVVYALGALLAAFLFGGWSVLWGNDSAAEVAAGGIQLRKEARISMEKERLTVSLNKVTVEYEFLNTTDQDITTEVAFPIPPYEFDPESAGGTRDFNDFRVWVDGEEVKYQTQVRAKLKGIDHTRLLAHLGINIQTFALLLEGDNYDKNVSQIGKLPKSEQQRLIQSGLTDESGFPLWTVVKTYHWRQVFPAGKTLKVRHEYTPGYGFEPFYLAGSLKQLATPCRDPALGKKLRAEQDMYFKTGQYKSLPLTEVSWVKYILTTANTWKTPIKDFELILEPPDRTGQIPQPKYLGARVCWDGKVPATDRGRLVVRRFNYIPATELSVYFFEELTPYKPDDYGVH